MPPPLSSDLPPGPEEAGPSRSSPLTGDSTKRTPAPGAADAIKIPHTEQDWDMFLLRYYQGALSGHDFTGDDARPGTSTAQSSQIQPDTASSRTNLDSHPDPEPQTPLPPLEKLSLADPSPPPHEPEPKLPVNPSPPPDVIAQDFAQNSDENPSPDEMGGQDPDIPNMPLAQQNPTFSKEPKPALFRRRRRGDETQERGGLTAENMRKFNTQDGGQVREREAAEGGDELHGGSRDKKKSSKGKERDLAGRNEAKSAPSIRRNLLHSSEDEEDSEDQEVDAVQAADGSTNAKRRSRPPRPRSRGSLGSYSRAGSYVSRRSRQEGDPQPTTAGDHLILESTTGTSYSGRSGASNLDLDYDLAKDRRRVQAFYEAQGYLPPPRQSHEVMRRRLRVLRRLGLERPEKSELLQYNRSLDRFTRLAVNTLKMKSAFISIIGKHQQYHLSQTDFAVGCKIDLSPSLCAHTVISTQRPGLVPSVNELMVVEDATKDWRFKHNPMVANEEDPVKFYAGAPLVIGSGSKAVAIGTLCVLGSEPGALDESQRALLVDLADCVCGELELIYTQQATIESAKLHQISVDFLRRSLKARPNEHAGRSRLSVTHSTVTGGSNEGRDSAGKSSGNKRKEGADANVSDDNIDIYDEACSEIRNALDAYAVAVVDLSQFHLFYPAFQGSSTAGSSTRGGSTTINSASKASSVSAGSTIHPGPLAKDPLRAGLSSSGSNDEGESYEKEAKSSRRARKTYALTDPTAPSRTPQVLYIPSGSRKMATKSRSKLHRSVQDQSKTASGNGQTAEQLAVLGYSCLRDNFVFDFTSTPAAKKVISDFIATNVKTRRVWYTRDESEGIAASITHLMPEGTETSLAMPIFGFDGQAAFAVVACWTDPLYTYPAGALQFVETIAGSLLASVMKERIHQAERAQLNFAAAASHELRTPLHQINAAASLLRSFLDSAFKSLTPLSSPAASLEGVVMNSSLETDFGVLAAAASSSVIDTSSSVKSVASDDRLDAYNQLDIIEMNGLALGEILENIIDTLDVGTLSNKLEQKIASFRTDHDIGLTAAAGSSGPGVSGPGHLAVKPIIPHDKKAAETLGSLMEESLLRIVMSENKQRRVSGNKLSLQESGVEIILEVLPRNRGGWRVAQDPGPLLRALGKIIFNSCKFTDKGYIHVIVQDVSRDVVLPAGYDNTIRTSIVSIDIKDSGSGMSAEFLESEVFQPFAKADAFVPGSGLGLGLAQRMIELLGGKLAIASTLGKGTLVHVEVPIHLLNDDNDSDQDEINARRDATDAADVSRSVWEGTPLPVLENIRQDGIYLAGFDSKDAGIKRIGKSLLRQLKLNFCRVVADVNYASLIVCPSAFSKETLAKLASQARPGAEIVIIDENRVNPDDRSALSVEASPPELSHEDQGILAGHRVRSLMRPLRPSVVSAIMQPPLSAPVFQETYRSDVTGGEEAKQERIRGNEHAANQIRRKSSVTDDQDSRTGDHTQTIGQGESTGDPHRGMTAPRRPNLNRRQTTGSNNSIIELLPSPKSSQAPTTGSSLMDEELTSLDEMVDASHLSRTSGSFGLALSDTDDEDHESLPPGSTHSAASKHGTSHASGSRNGKTEFAKARGVSQGLPGNADNASEGEGNGQKPSVHAGSDDSDGPYKVLVVEDNAINRKILVTMLKKTACSLAEAVDGVDAVNRFKTFRPHLILLDINMPRKDGFEASVEIRRHERDSTGPKTVIIAVTAMSSEAHRRKGLLECGIDVWRAKPVGIKDLRDEVERCRRMWAEGRP